VSFVLTLMAVLPTCVVQFSKDPSVLESFSLVAGHLNFDKGLQFYFMADFNIQLGLPDGRYFTGLAGILKTSA